MPENRDRIGDGPALEASTPSVRVPRNRTLKRRFRHIFTRGLRPAMNRMMEPYSLVGNPEVFDNRLFPWTRIFEEHYEDIRAEAKRLLNLRAAIPAFHEVSQYQRRISKGSAWKTLWLCGFGTTLSAATRLCPTTSALLGRVPELESACFSMLAPHAHIPGHGGVYKGLLNYHLGVIIPKQAEQCRIKVGDSAFHWEAGKSYVFDDTYRHEVWNETDEDRVVLFLQFRRPMRQPGRWFSDSFMALLRMTPFVRRPAKNIKKLDRALIRIAEEKGLL